MKKIVITGGLGYIGTEICKIYSGESRVNNICVIDSRFISERVSQLRKWGIDFHQCSILNKSEISEYISDADVVIHLAGVTDVSYVKSQQNAAQDHKIKSTGIDGTKNILSLMKRGSKIIFPSTHVIYEGLPNTKTQILEDEAPCPALSYSKSKLESEIDIKNSGVDYIILRLASVYGYSTDTMRLNIMPNLFAKIASEDGEIKLFSKGVQLKSLVPLLDVARCFKFMEESDLKNEIFNVSKDEVSVKDVAKLCLKFSPKTKIVETEDEIPNLGYTISNKKLLSTGFKFLFDLEKCIEEMIVNWRKLPVNQKLEYIKRGEKEFVDKRGKISNYELPEPINLIGLIESKFGSVRANHFHPIQEQKCLLISGAYVSVTKDLLVKDAPIETRMINAGDLAVIKPNVAHAMVFVEDSIFLNLVRGEREHDNYGVTHTIPYILVDETLRKNIVENYSAKCRSCGNSYLEDVLSLGLSPLANNLIDAKGDCEKHPLELKFCPKCTNVQLSYVVPPQKMFDNYLYVSSTAASFRKHFSDAADKFVKDFGLNNDSLVVDIGSNDGVFLKPLKEKGVNVVGVEPAKNLCAIAAKDGIDTINSYFNEFSATQILRKYGKADIVTASNVFAHSDELKNISQQAFRILKENGTFIIEVQYLLNTINDLTFDNIYHEHVNYWAVNSLKQFFLQMNLFINKVERINTHGGSIRVYVNRKENEDPSVKELILLENESGLSSLDCYLRFKSKIEHIKNKVTKNCSLLKQKYKKIYGYGSPAKATTSLNYFGVGNDVFAATVEDNPLKVGKVIPGVNIPIISKSQCLSDPPELIVVFAWNFFEEIKKNNKQLIDMGVKFISIKDLENE